MTYRAIGRAATRNCLPCRPLWYSHCLALLSLALLLSVAPLRLHAEPVKPIRLVTVVQPSHPVYRRLTGALDVIFARLKLNYTLESQPGERALITLKSGDADGDVGRGPIFAQSYPEAVRVEPSLGTSTFVAISASAEVSPKSWDELAKYKIAFRRGYKEIESRTTGTAVREMVNHDEACIGMVRLKRVDACVANAAQYDDAVLKDPSLHVSPVGTVETYIYMRPEHQELARKIGKIFAEIKKEATH